MEHNYFLLSTEVPESAVREWPSILGSGLSRTCSVAFTKHSFHVELFALVPTRSAFCAGWSDYIETQLDSRYFLLGSGVTFNDSNAARLTLVCM